VEDNYDENNPPGMSLLEPIKEENKED